MTHLSRRHFLQLVAGGVAIGVGASLLTSNRQIRGNNRQAKTPNIVFVMVDDFGFGDLSLYGNPYVHTPNLSDRLPSTGITLTQHYSASPICAPARAALLTGKYNHRVGAVDVPSNRGLDRINLDERLISTIFQQAGYTTGLVGKWHNGIHDFAYAPFNRGFDKFFGFMNGGMDYYDWVLYNDTDLIESDGQYLTHVLTEVGINFMENHRDEPFFLYMPYNTPHIPLQIPGDGAQYFAEEHNLSRALSHYYAMVEDIDAQVGHLLDALDRLDLADDTIFVFTADNGPDTYSEIGSIARENYIFSGDKREVLEGGIRVPTFLRWPNGLPSGVESDTISHFIDWLPTFAAAAEIPLSPTLDIDGFNLLPVLREKATLDERTVYWQYNRYKPVAQCNAAIRKGDWKLVFPPIEEAMQKLPEDNDAYRYGLTKPPEIFDIDPTLPERNLPPPHPPQLYNLIDDPSEQVDLSSAYPEMVAELTEEWNTWFNRVYADWQLTRTR
jgi:arylsulfatase A-like enzyme